MFEECGFKDVTFDGSAGSKSKLINCSFEGCTWVDSLWPGNTFSPSVPTGVPGSSRDGGV